MDPCSVYSVVRPIAVMIGQGRIMYALEAQNIGI